MNRFFKTDKPKLIFTALLLIIAGFLTICAVASYESNIAMIMFLFLLLLGVLLAFGTSLWVTKNRKQKFYESLKITIGICAFVYILGYLYFALEPILLK